LRPFSTIISIDDARALLRAGVRPVSRTERLDLPLAAGRVAAADVPSTILVPPFSRSAMDGYAVVAADTQGATNHHTVHNPKIQRVLNGR
jgi:molybdopterin molybdotransferase